MEHLIERQSVISSGGVAEGIARIMEAFASIIKAASEIRTWIGVAALGIATLFLFLLVPPSLDRTIATVGLLLIIALIVGLDYRGKTERIKQRVRTQAVLEAYDDLIKEFESSANDPNEPNRNRYSLAAKELKRYRRFVKS